MVGDKNISARAAADIKPDNYHGFDIHKKS